MFFKPKLNPSPAKKAIYLIAATIMGIELSFIVHGVMEYLYLDWAREASKTVIWYSAFGVAACSLHPVIQYGLVIIGALGGYATGKLWWRLVYVDKIWAKGISFHQPKENNN